MHIYKSNFHKDLFNVWDISITIIICGIIFAIGKGLHQMTLPISVIENTEIYLDFIHLLGYALQTVLRMFIAIIISLIAAIIYGTIAAKYKAAENILITILDIFQSVPILGFLTFTVTWFISIFPSNGMGLECAVIFAIFTNQVPNIAFSFYQSVKSIPTDLVEACGIFKLSPMKKFLKLELPFATQGLIWNSMMSMSGGWFLLVASESITIKGNNVSVPGIGSYIAKAIYEKDISSIFYAIITMFLVIMLYDQIIFRPLIVWADKFRYETTTDVHTPKSIIVNILKKSKFSIGSFLFYIRNLFFIINAIVTPIIDMILNILHKFYIIFIESIPKRLINIIWYIVLASLIIYSLNKSYDLIKTTISLHELLLVIKLGFFTLVRVVAMVGLAIIIWVPIGVFIGLNPSRAEKVMPLIQFASAFPANFLFPFVVIFISHYHLNPNIALSFLMILGTQWYILFNVVAGTSAFPSDLKESTNIFRIKGWLWWKNIMFPGIFPYIITGVITAYGGAWNASIVAEIVSWGNIRISAVGLGSYITNAANVSDYERVALGVVVMSLYVIVISRLIWSPLYSFAVNKSKLN